METVYPSETVTHPYVNQARRRLTSVIKPTPLTTTPRRQTVACYTKIEIFCTILYKVMSLYRANNRDIESKARAITQQKRIARTD